VIAFIVLILHQRGYFPFLNGSHVGGFPRYIFMLCIIWGYFFFANIILNWFLPFVLLMPKVTAKNKMVVKIVILFLIVGQFIDLYLQIFPGTLGEQVLGFQEIGMFVGFAGLFMLVTGYALTRAKLYPLNHPYLEESKHHHT